MQSPPIRQPPIQTMSGNGLMAHIYAQGGEARARVRRHIRRAYHDGTQYAFQYFTMPDEAARQIARVKKFIEEGD